MVLRTLGILASVSSYWYFAELNVNAYTVNIIRTESLCGRRRTKVRRRVPRCALNLRRGTTGVPAFVPFKFVRGVRSASACT